MSKTPENQIVTANDLMEGDVIYMTDNGEWTRRMAEAAVAQTEQQAKALLAEALAQPHRLVGAYLTAVDLDDAGKPRPNHFREAFRATGPSNRHHGKQAEL